ncbi:MAG: AAA family ATPase, partial [Thermoprotei archaeon]
MGSTDYIELRVETAKQRDVGKKIARISRRFMRTLGVNYGDFIEVEGSKGSVILQVWPAYREDENRDVVRIDGYTREAIGAAVGEYVRIRKAVVERGTKVVLAPTVPIRFDPTFPGYVKEQLLYRPVKRGEVVFVPFPLFGEPLRFVVISTQPSQAIYIDETTDVVLRTEPVKEEALARGIPRVTWEDIGDLEEVKERVREIVELPMRHPELFKHLGIEPPKGILLHGPPGVGKTLLAKALANEIGAYFVAVNGPEIMSKFYGESEARLREIFSEAEKNAPSLIFIDEIDAIAPKREEVVGEVEKRVVAQLLTLMDGLKERGKIVVIGATNRIEAVDPALRRPGRFDREIEIPPPDKRARKAILEVHTRNVPLANNVNLEEIAEITHGYTGADLAALVKEAAMSALRSFLKTEKVDLNRPIPPELLKKLRVEKRDFINAMKLVHPTLLREVLVEVPEVRWGDIGGLEEVKQQLREAVEWPLKRPDIFEKMGIRPPRGILLYGPPGCGKTLLAKAVATESGANFIAVKGPEILSKW